MNLRRLASLPLLLGSLLIYPACSGILETVDGTGSSLQCERDSDCTAGFTCDSTGRCYAAPTALCSDEDGDGFMRGPGCDGSLPIDCDDTDEYINPGVTEECGDNVDQNCQGGADEGCDCVDEEGEGTSRPCDFGICRGTQICQAAGWGDCMGGQEPTNELCGPDGTGNGLDEDCNNVADDDCAEFACPARPDGNGDEEICYDMGTAITCSSNGMCLPGPS